MIAAKGMVELLPEGPDAPPIPADKYDERYAALETAYHEFETFTSENRNEVKKLIGASAVGSAAKALFAASKLLRRTLDAPKLDRRQYVERIGRLAKNYNELIQRAESVR
jgi:hypothetical protein